MGIETPGLVEEVCAEISLATKPLYLKIDFLNGCKYDAQLDTDLISPSVSLGARLMYAFYGAPDISKYTGHVLKDIAHDNAFDRIVSTMLEQYPRNESIILPIVVISTSMVSLQKGSAEEGNS
jgi:hypothetical protein